MFDWLFEGQTTVYLVLATALLAFLFIYWQWRRGTWLYAMAAIVALIGLYALLDRLVETDREQIQRQIEAMAAAVRNHDADAVFEHISEQFQSPGGSDKATFRSLVAPRIAGVQELTLWDFRHEGRPERGKDYSGMRFRFKLVPTGLGADPWFDFVPTFIFDPAKGWQMKGFKVIEPGKTDAAEVQVPF